MRMFRLGSIPSDTQHTSTSSAAAGLSTVTSILFACIKHNACIIDILSVRAYKFLVIPDPIYKHIGELIKNRRKKLGWKQQNLASTLHISRGSLANIETGRQNILVHQLYKFAVALQLSPFDLLPPPSTKVDRTDLPLPTDLKAQQKQQVANFFSRIDTNQKPERDNSHAKPKKR